MKMNSINLIRVYMSTICLLILVTDSFSSLQSLKRETRFTKFEVICSDKSIVNIMEATIKHIREKQMLFGHFIVHKNITAISGYFHVFKCKNYYIDCVNVISYGIADICSNIKIINFLTNTSGENSQKYSCPFYGEYFCNNVTINADKFGAVFGSPIERYWEYYWKMNLQYHYPNNTFICNTNLDFYFLQFRNRKPKN